MLFRSETVDVLARWLGLPETGASGAVERTLSNRDFIVVDSTTPVEKVVRSARVNRVSHVVVRRRVGDEILHYAPTPGEITHAAAMRGGTTVEQALDLHEWKESAGVQRGSGALSSLGLQRPRERAVPEFSSRTVLLEGSKPVAVMPAAWPNIDVLVDVAASMIPPRQQQQQQQQQQRQVPPALRGRQDEIPQQRQQSETPSGVAIQLPGVCNAMAEMPAEVEIGKPTLVTVTLSAEALAITIGALQAGGQFVPQAGKPIVVEVMPRAGFKLASEVPEDSRAELKDPPLAGSPITVDVNVVATDLGLGEIWVIVRQGAVRALTLTLRPNVVTALRGEARKAVAKSGKVPAGDDLADVATLEISQQRNGDETRFVFRVNAPRYALNRFESAPLKGDLEAWIEGLYKDIQEAWVGSDSSMQIFHDALRAKGKALFQQLVPESLRKLLWKIHSEEELSSILVLSDEPFVPWEIVYLEGIDDGKTKPCFFGELGLCRWLFGAVPATRIEVRRGRARYVIPHYPDDRYRLVAAETVEEPMVKTTINASRIEPHYPMVKEALNGSGIDLFHFAGHGGAEFRRIDNAIMLLEGDIVDQEYQTEPLMARTVDSEAVLRGKDGRRPLVMLNACQVGRIGFELTSLGGFAAAFLGIREGDGDAIGKAGAFVGPLWSVGDAPASHFAKGFYDVLVAPGGGTMRDAAVAGRKAAREAGDATWLAYAVYAHPNCRVEFV